MFSVYISQLLQHVPLVKLYYRLQYSATLYHTVWVNTAMSQMWLTESGWQSARPMGYSLSGLWDYWAVTVGYTSPLYPCYSLSFPGAVLGTLFWGR